MDGVNFSFVETAKNYFMGLVVKPAWTFERCFIIHVGLLLKGHVESNPQFSFQPGPLTKRKKHALVYHLHLEYFYNTGHW